MGRFYLAMSQAFVAFALIYRTVILQLVRDVTRLQ